MMDLPFGNLFADWRDARMRRYLGSRYDSRENAIDWDYHMKLRDAVCYFKMIGSSNFHYIQTRISSMATAWNCIRST